MHGHSLQTPERPDGPRGRPAALLRTALRTALLTACLASLVGCIVVPQTQRVYDPDCKMHTHQVTLEAAVLGGFHRCAGDGCLALLAAAGVVTAASLVVSGSIALVGNVVYWIERQGRCPRAPAAAPWGAPSSALSVAPSSAPSSAPFPAP